MIGLFCHMFICDEQHNDFHLFHDIFYYYMFNIFNMIVK